MQQLMSAPLSCKHMQQQKVWSNNNDTATEWHRVTKLFMQH